MVVQIDSKNKIRVMHDCYILMKLCQRNGSAVWTDYRWFNSLEQCIKYLTQKRLAEREKCYSLEAFLLEYQKTMQTIESMFEKVT